MRTATGFTAGPDIPPVLLAIAKVRRLISIFIPVSVLIKDKASAPPASAARAISVISVRDKAGEALVREIQLHVKETTAPYKYPRVVEFVDELPKTISGKVKHYEIRRRR